MKLYRTAKWYNPFSIDVNNKSYELCDIVFFDKDGVICRTNRGWFESGISTNNKFDYLEIPGDVKKKIKVDFNENKPLSFAPKGPAVWQIMCFTSQAHPWACQLRQLCALQWRTTIGRLRGRRTSTGCQ